MVMRIEIVPRRKALRARREVEEEAVLRVRTAIVEVRDGETRVSSLARRGAEEVEWVNIRVEG